MEYLNRKKITKSKPNDHAKEINPRRRTVNSSFSISQTQSSTDSSNSIFKTPESIRNVPEHSTISSEF